MKLTLGNIKAGRIPHILGVCADDARLLQWLNEAQERLMNCGRWFGTVVRGRFCVTDACITWPREAAFIEAIRLCDQPISIRNMWYEFREYVDPVSCSDCTCTSNDPHLVDHGLSPTVADITGTDKKVIAYARHADDEGKYIIVQGRDDNAQWIRTDIGTDVIDGERIALTVAGTVSTNHFDGGVTGVQKDATDYNVLLYQYNDTTAAVEHLLGNYQPTELNPNYRRSKILNIENSCCDIDTCDDKYTIEAIVTLQHVPVAVDTDWLLIQNETALKFACMAIKAEEEGRQEAAEIEFKKAIRELQRQHDKLGGQKYTITASGHGTAHPRRVFAGFI